MQWTAQQEKALKDVSRWLKDPKAPLIYRLFGFAGTGKTTLAKYLAEGIQIVYFVAFTGKAADVLRRKGCPAQTIHSLIYATSVTSRKKLKELEQSLKELDKQLPATLQKRKIRQQLVKDIAAEKKNTDQPNFRFNPNGKAKDADLIVVDEASMIPESMAKDLLKYNVKILALGDPAQLPPVRGRGYFTAAKPDTMLTDITRQAENSPIIRLATQVRQREALSLGQYGNSSVITKAELAPFDVLASDQLLVGRNKTRRSFNARIRELKKLPKGRPADGDKLVCLNNNSDHGLFNGAIWNLEKYKEFDDELCTLDIRSEDGEMALFDLPAHMHYLAGRTEDLPYWSLDGAELFDYGYALTVHKSQGSQWPNVMVFDESKGFSDKHKWLYTAITRASETVTVVR